MRASWRSPYHRPTVAAGDAEVQVANAMAELATLTGISPASADCAFRPGFASKPSFLSHDLPTVATHKPACLLALLTFSGTTS